MHVVQFFALGSGLRRPSRATHSCAKFQAAVPRAARTGPASRAERVSQRLRQARVATRALCRMVRHCLRFRAKRRGWPGQPAEDSALLLALRSAASGRRVLHHDRPRQNIGDHTSNGPCVPRSGCGENSTPSSPKHSPPSQGTHQALGAATGRGRPRPWIGSQHSPADDPIGHRRRKRPAPSTESKFWTIVPVLAVASASLAVPRVAKPWSTTPGFRRPSEPDRS